MIIEELTMDEFAGGLQRTRTIVIPFGSLEEHGPHLPLATDTMTADHAARAASRLGSLFVAPAVPYGMCRSTSNHPGTVSIRGNTLRSLVKDLAHDFYRQGLRNFILLSGHAGGTHLAALVEAGEELLSELEDIKVAVASLLDLAGPAWAEISETERDSHAGEVETSLVLHFAPHLVKGRAAEEYPDFPKHILVRDKRRYWPGGVWGDPGAASPEKGGALLEAAARALLDLASRLESLDD